VAHATPGGSAGATGSPQLRDLAAEFEGILIGQLLKTLRGPAFKGGVFPEAAGRQVFEELLDGELARTIARGRGLGLAQMLVRELERLESGAKNPSSPAAVGPIDRERAPAEPDGGAT
jgi:flagellar protein FlgJ